MGEKTNAREIEAYKARKDSLHKRKEPPAINIYMAYSIYFREAWRNALKRYS